jgi:2-methylisocitrate lyase-like PEP mutase family enzyme
MSTSFRDLHFGGAPLLLPNAWDHASAALFADGGFAAIGTTSLGVSAAAGLIDGAGAAAEETIGLAIDLGGRGFMVSADIEGGFSDDPVAVAELCARLWDAGVAGVNLEDGRADGSLRDASTHAAILAAVKSAAPALFVNARTDTYWLGAGGMTETVDRLKAYVDAGADGVFVPGMTDQQELERAVATTPAPLNALFSTSGPTISELTEVGVARVSFGSWLFRIALSAAADALRTVSQGGDPRALTEIDYEAVQKLSRDREN